MSMLMKNSIYLNGRGRIIYSNNNSYLQQKTKISPMTVNNAMLTVFSKLNRDSFSSFSMLSDDSDEQDKLLKLKIVEYTPGFGRTGLDRLIEEIRNVDIINILIPALTSMMEQVQDSEKAFYLIDRGVVGRLYFLLLVFETSNDEWDEKSPNYEIDNNSKEGVQEIGHGTEGVRKIENDTAEENEDDVYVMEIRKKACITLRHLAKLYQGNLAIVENELLIEALKVIMCEHHNLDVRVEASRTINTLCKNVLLAHVMAVKYSFTVLLMERIQCELFNEIRMIHFDSFIALLNCDQSGAIENNGINIMRKLLTSTDKSIVRKAMKAISIMLIYLEDIQEGHTTHPLIKNTVDYFMTTGIKYP